MQNIYNRIEDLKDTIFLKKLIAKANNGNILKSKGPYTFFAPMDSYFLEMTNQEFFDGLVEPDSGSDLLSKKIVLGFLKREDLLKMDEIETLSNDSYKINLVDGEILISDFKITESDLLCSNGLIHLVDIAQF